MDELKRQLELQEEENRRLKAKFALENKRLRDSLGTLTQELNEIQARILQQKQHPLKQQEVQISPDKRSQSPAAPISLEKSTQCDEPVVSLTNSSTQYDLVEVADVFSQSSRSCEVQTPHVEAIAQVATSSSFLLGNTTPAANKNASAAVSSQDGLVQSPSSRKPFAASLEDLEVPTLAKEADRLLSVITRLRMERATPHKVAPAL